MPSVDQAYQLELQRRRAQAAAQGQASNFGAAPVDYRTDAARASSPAPSGLSGGNLRAPPVTTPVGGGGRQDPNSWDNMLSAFLQEMSQPFDPNDPRYSRILDGIRSRIGRGLSGRGVEGGLSRGAVSAGLADASLRFQDQRRAAFLQGMGLRAQKDLTTAQQNIALQGLNETARQFDMGQYNQQQAHGLSNSQGVGSIIGGLAGAAGFLVPGAGPVLGPALSGVGSQLGGAIGGLGYQPGVRPSGNRYGPRGDDGGSY